MDLKVLEPERMFLVRAAEGGPCTSNNKWRKYLACTHIRSIPDKGFDPEQIMLKDLLSP